MLIIRLRRIGKKNNPTYRVVVAEHSYPIDGKFTADLGFYNPHTKKNGLDIKKVSLWLDKGAKPSNTVAKILLNEKLKHKSVVIHTRNRKPKAELKPAAKNAAEAKPSAVEPENSATLEADNEAQVAEDESPTAATEETAPSEEPTPEA